MVDDRGLELVLHRVRELIEDHTQAVAGGACKDFPSYREACGKVAALKEVESVVIDTHRQLSA